MTKDLFETPSKLPKKVKAILSRYNDLEMEKGIQYMPTLSKWAKKWLFMAINLIFILIVYLIIYKK